MHIKNEFFDTRDRIGSPISVRRQKCLRKIASGRFRWLALLSFLLAVSITPGCGVALKKNSLCAVPVSCEDRIEATAGPATKSADAEKGLPGDPIASMGEDQEDVFDPDFALDTNDVSNPCEKKIQVLLDEALELCQAAQSFWEMGELDNAIQSLDQAYALIIGISPEENSKIMRQKDDLRFHISKRILEIYASRHVVAKGQHKAIPITINEHVQKEIDLFTKGAESEFFLRAYRQSGSYRPMIVTMLKEAGLPESLSWLPLIESGYNPKALSKARALGLWQFIPSTGLKFGLNRDLFIDERLDPVKSTRAAIDYLKELHQIFGDWTTVLAAYNCGEGRVLRIIREQNINYLDNFWDLYQRLPKETARYVPRFLATIHIMSNPEKYALNLVEPHAPVEYEVVNLQRSVSLADIAHCLNIPLPLVKELNPELRHDILPSEPYNLRIPVGGKQTLLALIDTIPVSRGPSSSPSYVYHRVRSGQTLSTIAAGYGTSVNAIIRANNIRRKDVIVAGKMLKIPGGKRIATDLPSPGHGSAQATKHVVQRGDSLWNIAKRYGATTKSIQDANCLNTHTIQVGQVLNIPGQASLTEARPEGKTFYLVKVGDSPYTIARQHNLSLERFLENNRLNKDSTIHPGQKLIVD